ncbi:ATP-binding cassette domain-containing protein [Georgenia alba]|uniref:ATP-binding cassette domain-containing protein n=1 Tax=Georgenia alba TaxID=2233858 RepID=A0ABW2QB83_9MICO
MSDPDIAFETRGLVKRFGDTTALAGLDLAARTGTVLGVLGPNGAGKSTAINVLATLTRPDEGWARVGAYDVVRDARSVRRLIGLTGQAATVDEDLTGRENLVLFGKLLDLPTRRARLRADELLDEFGLRDAADKRLSTYSGGMRRRLDLAAGLVGDPSVVFLDEPTTGLDPRKRDDMWDTVRSLVGAGVTVLLTTQYLEEADALADEIAVIDHGRVIAHDTPAGLKQTAGRQTAVVRPRDPADLARAAEVVARVTQGSAVHPVGGALTVPVDDDETFTRLVQGLSAAGVSVAELALRLPSLDDVFLSLTGTTAVAGESPPESGATADAEERVAS